MFGTRIYVPETQEGSALGAAVMAWVALGFAPDILITRKMGRAKTYIVPNNQIHKYCQQQSEKAEKILKTLNPLDLDTFGLSFHCFEQDFNNEKTQRIDYRTLFW